MDPNLIVLLNNLMWIFHFITGTWYDFTAV
jgi:hypothetical protein